MLGTVYVLKDKGRPFIDKDPPGIVKIGYTTRLTMQRQQEIENTMAKGSSLALIYAVDWVPFPKAVEAVAHAIMSRRRVRWPRGSPRGQEWFHARGDAGEAKAINAVQNAVLIVRARARKKKRWPDSADRYVSVWRLSGKEVLKYKFFR